MLSLFQIKQILHPVTETLPTDDFRILDSWAEYDENSSKDPEKRNLQYLCYEMEVMNPSTERGVILWNLMHFLFLFYWG